MSSNKPKPVILVILDGWGEWDQEKGNVISLAELPTINELNNYYPKLLLQASGLSVGLPWGVRGNSEVGHQTIGAGQIIFQYLPTIDMAIENKSFEKNNVLLDAIEWSKKNKSKLHLMGLLSDGSVHSHINHLVALLQLAKKEKFEDVYIHAITDGRDSSPKSAEQYLSSIMSTCRDLKIGKIASVSGRYYAMDRNNNWERLEKAFLAFTEGTRIKERDPLEVIKGQYHRGITDEYFEPVTLVDDNDKPVGLIEDNDSIICFNYRKDRSRQLTRAFVDPNFNEFKVKRPENIRYTAFVEYEPGFPIQVAFPAQEITTRLGGIIAEENMKQLRIAETEKFAHVTYFFNGGLEEPYTNEDRILVLSKKTDTYAKIPEMSAVEVTDKLLTAIDQEKYDFILVNYANPDMVGHTGDLKAGIKAVTVVDECLKKVIDKVVGIGGALVITADHGNVEEMVDLTTFERDTEHSTNPVPCWIITSDNRREEAMEDFVPNIDGMIVDIAPTILDLLKIKKPREMIGRSLIDIAM